MSNGLVNQFQRNIVFNAVKTNNNLKSLACLFWHDNS